MKQRLESRHPGLAVSLLPMSTRGDALLDRRLAPDMYTMVLASQQVFGDSFALHVAETIRSYEYAEGPSGETIDWGAGACVLPATRRSRASTALAS